MRMLMIAFVTVIPSIAFGQEPATRSLSDLAAEAQSYKIYLAAMPDMDSRHQTALGIKPYPSTGNGTDAPKIYRFLGLHPGSLNCDSTALVALNINVQDAGFKCDNDPVKYVLIPLDDNVPYTSIKWGNSVKDIAGCACCKEAEGIDCGGSLRVSVTSNGIRVRGDVHCIGIECDIDETLSRPDDSATAECRTPVGRVQGRVTLLDEDNCVKLEARARYAGGSWSRWYTIGRYCP